MLCGALEQADGLGGIVMVRIIVRAICTKGCARHWDVFMTRRGGASRRLRFAVVPLTVKLLMIVGVGKMSVMGMSAVIVSVLSGRLDLVIVLSIIDILL
jgi:hypothetical protein